MKFSQIRSAKKYGSGLLRSEWKDDFMVGLLVTICPSSDRVVTRSAISKVS